MKSGFVIVLLRWVLGFLLMAAVSSAFQTHHRHATRQTPTKTPLRPPKDSLHSKSRITLTSRQFTCYATTNASISTKEDYLVTDSLHVLDDERPSLIDTLMNPRDALALSLITVAAGVSVCNILGDYSSTYSNLVRISIVLGFLSGMAGLAQAATGYQISRPWIDFGSKTRRGLPDDTNVNIYAGAYALTVSWLSLRTSTFCPDWLVSFDAVLPWVAISIFFLSVLTPAITLTNPGNILDDAPPLSETELLRMRGIMAIGILASVFAPECFMFAASGGSEWWDRVSALHPAQRTLESSTCLFALYANEASMVSHRCGRAGVATFSKIVPSFAVVCFLLAIVPCVAAIYWLGNDVSFFSIYTE